MKVKNIIPRYESDVSRREEQKKVYRLLLLQLSSNDSEKKCSVNKDKAS